MNRRLIGALLVSCIVPAISGSSAPQVTFEDVSRDLANPDPAARLRATTV